MLRPIMPNSKVMAYIATTFGYIIMHNIFNFYYVKIFLNYYHVSSWWFQVSQFVFMIWNTINDPLFGYCQDNLKCGIFRKRRLSILIGAPFYGISFLLPWIPFSNDGFNVPPWVVGIHLMTALCLYDTLFTFVLLAHCCIFAEMEVDFQSRFNMKWWSVLAGLCGGISVPIANHLSDNLGCMYCFRWTCFGVAIIATCCMIYTGLFANTVYDEGHVSNEKETLESMYSLTKQILSERDFHGFVWLNFLHQGHAVFWANFTSIFIDFLQPGLTTHFLNIYFSILWTLPPLFVLLFRNFIETVGYYRIIKVSCILKIVGSTVVWFIGRVNYVFLVYLIFDSVLIHSTSNFYDIALSDIADKDRVLNKRKKPISSMIFATNALITKPAISLFPMLVVGILTSYGYRQKQQVDLAEFNETTLNKAIYLPDVVFALACWIPFSVGVFQLISWSFYTIRSSHNRSGPLTANIPEEIN